MGAIINITSFMPKVNTEPKRASVLLFTNQADQAGKNFSDLRKHLCLHTKNLCLYMHLPIPSTAKFGERFFLKNQENNYIDIVSIHNIYRQVFAT